MTEQEYKQKEAKIKERNKNITMKRKLHRMKKSRFKFKKIRTSKKVLWTIIVICLEILFFSEYMALKTEDTSFMIMSINVVNLKYHQMKTTLPPLMNKLTAMVLLDNK